MSSRKRPHSLDRRSLIFILCTLAISKIALPSAAHADTLRLYGGEDLKGLVVEEHQDRVTVSTADGERVILRKDIESIDYDDPEYSLLSLGREMEAKKKWAVALSYYEEALQKNPGLTEAKRAALGIKSKLWAKMVDQGPLGEVAKQQEIQDSWRANVEPENLARDKKKSDDKLLWERLGLSLKRIGDWVHVAQTRIGGPVYKAGLRGGDELSSIDGMSLRYLSEDAVTDLLLEPRYSNATLVIRRDIQVSKTGGVRTLKDMGLEVRLEYDGLTVRKARQMSKDTERKNPFKRGDLIVAIGDKLTRYMPLKDAVRLIENPETDELTFKISRSIMITRK